MHKGTAYISRSDSSYASSAPVPQNMQQMLKQLQALPPQNRQTISDLNAAYGSDLLLSLSACKSIASGLADSRGCGETCG